MPEVAVKVSDLLSLSLLREGQVAAGLGGLSKAVRAVSFSDYPIIFSEEEYQLTSEGDLYICSYYPFQDNMEKLYNRVRFYIRTKSSCLIISVERQAELPAEVIALANQHDYPIILLSDKVPYTAIIRTVTEAIFLDETSAALERKIDSLLYDRLSSDEAAALAKHFCSSLSAHYAAYFIALDGKTGKSRLGDLQEELNSRFRNREFTICHYRNLIFLTVAMERDTDFTGARNVIQTSLEQMGTPYHLGVSTPHQRLSDFPAALREAYQSCRIGLYQNKQVTQFGQAPFSDFLFELRHNASLIRYCEETLRPLLEYRQRHNVDLIETLQVFFRNNGNYKRTAADLFQHENTVRFRIAKAKSLLGLEQDGYRFIKEASLAIDCLTFLKEKE